MRLIALKEAEAVPPAQDMIPGLAFLKEFETRFREMDGRFAFAFFYEPFEDFSNIYRALQSSKLPFLRRS